jgi:heme-degrading monooxygenase HmoA
VLVILFRSKLTDDTDGYQAMAEEMLETARGMPGFIDFKSFRADDGERLSVARWEDAESLRAWREHARHRLAQRIGRERWYEYYDLEVAEVVRTRRFERPAPAVP